MLQYIIAGAIGFVVAKLFEDDETPKYEDGGLIAPNGKPSNLTPKQYKLVRTPAFKEWFGDWENDPETSSKVVDENGEPLVVFHGTKDDRFTNFNKNKVGGNSPLKDRKGFFFSSSEEEAEEYKNDFYYGGIFKIFLNIKNPYIYDKSKSDSYDSGIFWWDFKREEHLFNSKNNDGVIIYSKKSNLFVAFEPEQIKLADGSNTTFDGTNPDIRFDEGGEARPFTDDEAPKYADGGSVLLAPNGKPSNLTPEQYKLVRSQAFKKWFGDWENDPETASKVVDENGEPNMCFHATNNDFYVFDERTIGSANDRGFYGRGFYFTFQSDFKDKHYAINEALYYGKKLLNCYIKAINPFDFSILSMYKNKRINYIGAESLVFLTNISILFPQIADKIFIEKNTWNKFTQEYDVEELPISILPNLVTKYAKDLKLIETTGQFDRKETMGYVKSEIVKYEYTDKDGKQVADQYVSYDDLGRVQSEISKEEKEILFIELAIGKYEGISIRFQPEGYMTRNSIITDAIKEKHDCILQSKYGDELVVFQPNHIKLADGTNTTFDGTNPDIRFDEGGEARPFTDDGNKLVVFNQYRNYTPYKIAVDDVNNAEYITLWKTDTHTGKDKKMGYLRLNNLGDDFLSVSEISIDRGGKGLGLGLEMYKVALKYSSDKIKGIKSYLPNRTNKKQIPKIYKKLNSVKDGDYEFIYKQNNPDIRFNKGGEIKDLIVLHNINAHQIEEANKIGGLVTPSIAIVKAENSFTDFGSITLIGTKELIDPENSYVKVFAGDVYSPSVPRKLYYVDKRLLEKVTNELIKKAYRYDEVISKSNREIYSLVQRYVGDYSDFQKELNTRGVYELNDFYFDDFKLVYIVDKGIKIKVPMKEKKHFLWNNFEFTLTPEQKKRFAPILKEYTTESNEKGSSGVSKEIQSKVYDLFLEVLNNVKLENEKYKSKENGDFIYKVMNDGLDESFKKNVGTRYDWYGHIEYKLSRAVYGEQILDTEKFNQNIKKVFTKQVIEDYKKWLSNFINQFRGSAYFLKGNEKMPYTLDNLVDATSNRVIGQEKNITFGVNQAKSFGTKRLNSIVEIKKNSNKIISKDEMNLIDDKNKEVFFKLSESLEYEYSDTWGKLDSLGRALADYFKGTSIVSALRKNDFKTPSSYQVDLFKDFADELKNSPVDYFEAKYQRAVSLREFKYAVVPKETSKEVVKILLENGLIVKKYQSTEERIQIVNSISNKDKSIKFDDGGEINTNNPDIPFIAGGENDKQKIIKKTYGWYSSFKDRYYKDLNSAYSDIERVVEHNNKQFGSLFGNDNPKDIINLFNFIETQKGVVIKPKLKKIEPKRNIEYNTDIDLVNKQKNIWEYIHGIEIGRYLSDLQYINTNDEKIYGSEKPEEENIIALMNKLKNGDELPPILLDYDYGILDGHHRFEASKRLKIKKIPVIIYEYPDMSYDDEV